jgi:ankyrin repeat protein
VNDDLFRTLFHFLPEDNAEQLWLINIEEYLLSGGDKLIVNPGNGWGLLHYASENMFNSVVNMLLEKGIPVDVKAADGSTPYLIALDASIDAAIQQDEPEIDFSVVKILIEHGADMDVCSIDGISRESLLNNYGKQATEEYYNLFPEE